MTAATMKARNGDLLSIRAEMMDDIQRFAQEEGLRWQEWARSCIVREIARRKAERPKKGKGKGR